MPIEVKHLLVKGGIRREAEPDKQEDHPPVDLEACKQEILQACRRIIEDALRQSRER